MALRLVCVILIIVCLINTPALAQGYSQVGELVSLGAAPFSETWQHMVKRSSFSEGLPFQSSAYQYEVTSATASVGASFITTTLQDQIQDFGSGPRPPDTMGAVGPNHFLVMPNGTVAVYNKTGLRLSHVTMDSFFAVNSGGVNYPRNGMFDPRVIFDRRSNRWFACGIEIGNPTHNANHILLAVCRTSDPLMGVWDKYVIPVGEPPSGTTTYNTDFDTLGLDDNGVYFGMKIKSSNQGTRSKIAATGKASLVASSPSLGPVYQWGGISDMLAPPVPAHNQDAVGPSDRAWFVGSTANRPPSKQYQNVNYRTLTWNAGVPTLGSTKVLTTPYYSDVPDAPAYGGVTVVVNDDRLQMAVIRNNRLWTCRHIGVNNSGGSTSVDRAACEWLELNVSAQTPTLVQRGCVYDSATEPWFYYAPSIMVNGQGHAAMGFSASKANQYIGAYACSRLASDPVGTMSPVTAIKAGQAVYNNPSAGATQWTDYSYASVDPNDDMSLWTIQEYATNIGTNIWGTWVAQMLSPAPTLVNPAASGVRGRTGLSLNLAGTGFYDPGGDYTNRLGVCIGGGVINGVNNCVCAYNSPTGVTVTFDIAANATLGPRDVVLTNPDGQSATAIGGFTVNPDPNPVVDARMQPNDTSVTLSGAVVTAVWSGSSVFYVQAGPGIRVEKSEHGLAVGAKPLITGVVKTNSDGEHYIQASSAVSNGSGQISPLAMNDGTLGGGNWRYDPSTGAGQQGIKDAFGLNNIGMLVRACGRVTQRDTSGLSYLYVDDGSGLRDGTKTDGVDNVGVRVDANPTAYSAGWYVAVTGISSCFKDSSANIRRKLLPLTGGIQTLKR